MFFSKKNRRDFNDIVIHLNVSFELLAVLPFLSFSRSQSPKLPGEKIPVLQTIIIRRIIINQIASSSVFYSFFALVKVHKYRFKNLPTYMRPNKNTLKISHC